MTKRCVLFLDIDGVLNSHWHAVRSCDLPLPPTPEPTDDEKERDLRCMESDVDPALAWNLGFIAKHVPGLEIVISSTWRSTFDLPLFQILFETRLGLKGIKVIGATPRVVDGQKMSESVPRIAQIDDYRKKHGLAWSEVVILDDHSVAPNTDFVGARWLPEDSAWGERFVQTDQRDGLTYSRSWDVITKFIGWEAFKPPICLM